jgi:hypothetical protein
MNYLRENIQWEVGSRFTVSTARKRNRTRRNARAEHTVVRGKSCSNRTDERSREYDVTLVWYRSWVYVTRVSTSRRSPSAQSNDEGGDSCITQRTYTAVLFSLRFVRYTTTVTLSVPPGAENNTITAHSALIKFYKSFVIVSVLFTQIHLNIKIIFTNKYALLLYT